MTQLILNHSRPLVSKRYAWERSWPTLENIVGFGSRETQLAFVTSTV